MTSCLVLFVMHDLISFHDILNGTSWVDRLQRLWLHLIFMWFPRMKCSWGGSNNYSISNASCSCWSLCCCCIKNSWWWIKDRWLLRPRVAVGVPSDDLRWTFMCFDKWSDLEKDLPQESQAYGLIPEWHLLCLESSSLLLNLQSHPGHWQTKGFSPVCLLTWTFKWDDL